MWKKTRLNSVKENKTSDRITFPRTDRVISRLMKPELTVLFVRLVRTVRLSVAELAAADALAPIKARLLPRGAVGEGCTGSGIGNGEAPPTFTRPTSRKRQTQLGASPVVVRAAVTSWRV